MATLKQTFSQVFSFLIGTNTRLPSEDARRDSLVILIALLATLVLFGVALLSWLDGHFSTAVIDASAGLFLLSLLLTYRFTTFKPHCRYIGVAMMYVLYFYLFITEAAGGMTFVWHYTFPFFAIFLIGSRDGAIATLLLFIPVFYQVLIDAYSIQDGLYTPLFATRFIPSVSVALVFAYLFERERERFRRQTRKAYEEQERIIEERTQQLQKQTEEREKIAEQLRQSQKMEAIGTMASGVAHDLNNILTGIVTYPELIRLDLPGNSPLHTPLKGIEDAGKRAASVVTDLLTIARNAASVKEVLDLNLLITEILESPEWINFISNYPQVLIQKDLSEQPAAVKCSPAHLRKSFMNLLINGVEATAPEGNVTLSSRVVDNHTVKITFRDGGPGIPAHHIDHIFEPFYTTKKMGRSGSGLGLAVVWNSVEEHQGNVVVESTPTGAVFTVELPAVDPSGLSSNLPQKTPYTEYTGKGTVLVIDDEQQPRELALRIVTKLGYSAESAKSGEEAVIAVQHKQPDIILLDMELGEGLNGLETFKKIISLYPEQKAIIVSGYSTSNNVYETLHLGASSIVKKPYTIGDIGKAIQQTLMGDLPPSSSNQNSG